MSLSDMTIEQALLKAQGRIIEARDAEIAKLRAEMAISPDELLPMKLMNARLIEENEELRRLYELSSKHRILRDYGWGEVMDWAKQADKDAEESK